jgi:hypothetical protein
MHAPLPLEFKGPLPTRGGLACSNMKLKLQLRATNQLKFISACYLVSPAYQQPLFFFFFFPMSKTQIFLLPQNSRGRRNRLPPPTPILLFFTSFFYSLFWVNYSIGT